MSLIRPLQQQQLPGKTSHPESNNTSIDPLSGRLAMVLGESESPEAATYCHGNHGACGLCVCVHMRACIDNLIDGKPLAVMIPM